MTAVNSQAAAVNSVEGPLDASRLGLVLPHEHLIVEGWSHTETNYENSAFMELAKFVEAGGRTVVDWSSVGRVRDPVFARKLAKRAGIQLVLGTGFCRDGRLPAEVQQMSVETMTDLIVTELKDGIAGTGVKAGVIGEIGVSRRPTRTEDRVLAAAAKAQARTGAAIGVTIELGAPATVYERTLGILQDEGADLHRVAVGNLVARVNNLEICQAVAARGCFVMFDLFGQQQRALMRELIATHPESTPTFPEASGRPSSAPTGATSGISRAGRWWPRSRAPGGRSRLSA